MGGGAGLASPTYLNEIELSPTRWIPCHASSVTPTLSEK
jgi:hypothetical protein